MQVMMMIKGDPQPGAAPDEELLAAMGSYNDELKQAGVLLDLAGLLPSVEGRRVRFSEEDRTVIDGPFPESKQLVAGYWILQVPSMGRAVPVPDVVPDLPGPVRRRGRDRDPSGVRAGGSCSTELTVRERSSRPEHGAVLRRAYGNAPPVSRPSRPPPAPGRSGSAGGSACPGAG